MKNNESIFFGIEFPPNLNFAPNEKQRLARLLFLSPSTSPEEAKKLVSLVDLQARYEELIDTLQEEVEEFISIEDNDSTELGIRLLINQTKDKLKQWTKVFKFPEETEISDLFVSTTQSVREDLKKLLAIMRSEKLKTPRDIAAQLSQYIIGQQEAVNSVSVLLMDQKVKAGQNVTFPSSSLLMIGNTGTGKSYLVQKASEMFDIPMIRINCGDLVPNGIMGNTINKFMTHYFQSTGQNLEKASYGIIYFDELDKITAAHQQNAENFKTTIQLEILNFFDQGENIHFPKTFEQHPGWVDLPNENLMLVFSGAFSGLDDIIYKRVLIEYNGNEMLVDRENILQFCNSEDLIEYGIIPELAGRISYVCPLRPLNKDDIYSILKNAKESEIVKHKSKCSYYDINLTFTEQALSKISELVIENKLGVRSIQGILNRIMMPVYFRYECYAGFDYVVDDTTINGVYGNYRYQSVMNAIEEGKSFDDIAIHFNISHDEIIDIYSHWKSFKK